MAPLGVAEQVVPEATDIAAEIMGEVGADHTALMGDSAGGGMTVAVALQLRDRGLAAPYRTVLISPWLDVSLTAPDIPALAAKDPFLAPAGLVAAGELYRGELPAEDPRVSPINGDLSRLGPITLLSGTHDILHSDAKRFVPLAKKAGVSITTTKRRACSTSTPCSRSRRPSRRVEPSSKRSPPHAGPERRVRVGGDLLSPTLSEVRAGSKEKSPQKLKDPPHHQQDADSEGGPAGDSARVPTDPALEARDGAEVRSGAKAKPSTGISSRII